MRTDVQQMIALQIVGTAALQGRAPKSFWPHYAAFRKCKQVTFVTLSQPDGNETPYASDPLAWFAKLASEGIKRLLVRRSGMRVTGSWTLQTLPSAAKLPLTDPKEILSRSVTWQLLHAEEEARLIEEARRVAQGAAVDLWQSRWEGTHHAGWSITYVRVRQGAYPIVPRLPIRSISEARDQIRTALDHVYVFAREKRPEFATYFNDAIIALDSQSPSLKGTAFADLKAYLNLEAQQLLAAAARSWIIGTSGMSWWSDGDTGGDVTVALEDAVDDAILAVTEGEAEPQRS